jgi:hypothetical protein
MSASQANLMQTEVHQEKGWLSVGLLEAKTSMTGDLVRSPDDDL